MEQNKQDARCDDLKRLSYEFVKEWSKQIATISSAALVLSATFVKDIVGVISGKTPDIKCCWLLFITWAMFLLATICHPIVIMRLIGEIAKNKELDVYNKPLRVLAITQFFLFVTGMIGFLVFAGLNLRSH